jgi:hypothetical protein
VCELDVIVEIVPAASSGTRGATVSVSKGVLRVFDATTGQWQYVCGSNYDALTNKVFCRMAGYSTAVDYALTTAPTGASTTRIYSGLACSGLEEDVDDCPQTANECSETRVVTIECGLSSVQKSSFSIETTTTDGAWARSSTVCRVVLVVACACHRWLLCRCHLSLLQGRR